MKFLVEKEPLTDAVNWVARSLSARPLQTSLLGIVINVESLITFTGSNLETTTEAVISADILEKGRVLVPGRLLADIARSLPDKPITFALNKFDNKKLSDPFKHTISYIVFILDISTLEVNTSFIVSMFNLAII